MIAKNKEELADIATQLATQPTAVAEAKNTDGWKTRFRYGNFDPVDNRKPTRYGGVRKTLRTKFNHCVKAVRKTVKARKGSNKESAAIAICTKTILHPRGRTLKRYTKERLLTQKKK